LADDPSRIEAMSRAAIGHRVEVEQSSHRDALVGVYRAAIRGA